MLTNTQSDRSNSTTFQPPVQPILSSETKSEHTGLSPCNPNLKIELGALARDTDMESNSKISSGVDLGNDPAPCPEKCIFDYTKANPSAEADVVKLAIQSNERALKRWKPSLCVFVASLPALLTDDELCRLVSDHFQVFGELVSVKVLRDPANRPYAFVQYTNDIDCRTAIQLGHDSELGGRRLRCEAAKVNRTLFFLFTEPRTKDEVSAIVDVFGESDAILPGTNSGRLARISSDSTSHNWFVKFAYRDEAIQAFAKLSDAGAFQVEWAQNIDDAESLQESGFDRSLVYIGQLSSEVSTEALQEHFGIHGTINSINIVRKPDSTFAFISFKDESGAASAVARDNHTLFMNKTIHVKYRMSAPKRMTRVILSPRVPVALAPPPLQKRDRYADTWGKWACLVKGNALVSTGPLSPIPGILNSAQSPGLKKGSYQASMVSAREQSPGKHYSTRNWDSDIEIGKCGRNSYQRFKENRPQPDPSARYFIIPKSD